MTDKKEDTGKGPAKPGDAPRRPYATIELQATEIGGKDTGERASDHPKPGAASSSLPPPGTGKTEARRSGLTARLATARGWSRRATQSNTFLSHVAAGVAGAVLTLVAGALLGLLPDSGENRQIAPDVDQRLATLEQTLRQRTATPGADVTAKLSLTDTRLKGLEDQSRAVTTLSDTQTRLAAAIKSLEVRSTSPEYANRLAKLETSLAALSAGDKSGAQSTALAEKLAELEKLVGDAAEASKSGVARADRDLAILKTDAGRLGQHLDTLKGDIDDRLKGTAKSADLTAIAAKLAAFEQSLQTFIKGEGERTSNAARVLLTLEIASLKRAMDRGDRYTAELDAVRKISGTALNLAPLEHYSLEGAPTLPALAKDFRRVANAAIDAEAEPADASVLDRLMSGARSIVRVRKAGHDPTDASTEAVVARVEAALKDGRLSDVLEQGRKLPPKAALAADDWLKKVEARNAVDRALVAIEAALKSSLGAPPAAEPKR